jgi:hypothetical protein
LVREKTCVSVKIDNVLYKKIVWSSLLDPEEDQQGRPPESMIRLKKTILKLEAIALPSIPERLVETGSFGEHPACGRGNSLCAQL